MAEKQMFLKFRARANSLVGKMLDAVKQYPGEEQAIVQETLSARFVPLVLEVNEESRALALNYIELCEAYARISRMRWGLLNPQTIQLEVRTAGVAPAEMLPPQTQKEVLLPSQNQKENFVDGWGNTFEGQA